MLIGAKRNFAPVKAWFQAWQNGHQPSQYPLIVIGDAGCGKTTVVKHYAEECAFDLIISEAGESRTPTTMKRLFGDARMPTFFGQPRAVVIDDWELLLSPCVKELDEPVRQRSFPLVIIAPSEAAVPWKYRRGGLVHRIPNPSTSDLTAHLTAIAGDIDEDHLHWIAENASTWRQAELLLRTTPVGFSESIDDWKPSRFGHDEVASILAGDGDMNFSCHPLAVISCAEFNGCDPDVVIKAIELHSKAWSADLLSSISRGYISTMRTNTSQRPPFRQRNSTNRFLNK